MILSVVLALGAAVMFAVSTVAQQRAAAESSDADARQGRFVGQLLRNPRWLGSIAVNALAYVLQAAALGAGSVLIVSPILVASLVFALPLGAALDHRLLPRRAVIAGAVLAAALVAFLLLANPTAGAQHGSARGWLIAAACAAVVVVPCIVVANGRSGATRASLLAVPVGVLGGALSVLTKAVVSALPDGPGSVLATPETYGLVVVGVGGTYLQSLAFQAGNLQASLPVLTVLEPLVAAGLGFTLLHEQLDVTGGRLLALLVAVAVLAVATVALAREHAQLVGRGEVAAAGRASTGSLRLGEPPGEFVAEPVPGEPRRLDPG
jgi:drug/metabolite transporter (DMT)-like permease